MITLTEQLYLRWIILKTNNLHWDIKYSYLIRTIYAFVWLQVFLSNTNNFMVLSNKWYSSPVVWGCRIPNCIVAEGSHLYRNKWSVYESKQSDDEAPVLGLWGMWKTPSLPLLPRQPWPEVVATIRVLAICLGYDTKFHQMILALLPYILKPTPNFENFCLKTPL